MLNLDYNRLKVEYIIFPDEFIQKVRDHIKITEEDLKNPATHLGLKINRSRIDPKTKDRLLTEYFTIQDAYLKENPPNNYNSSWHSARIS